MRQNEKRRKDGHNDNRMQEPINTKLNVCVFHALSKQKALKNTHMFNHIKVTIWTRQEPQIASLYNFLKFIRFLKQDKCNLVFTKKV